MQVSHFAQKKAEASIATREICTYMCLRDACVFRTNPHKSSGKKGYCYVDAYRVPIRDTAWRLNSSCDKGLRFALAFTWMLNNSDVILWVYLYIYVRSEGTYIYALASLTSLPVRVPPFTPFSVSQMKGRFATGVTEGRRGLLRTAREGFCEPWDCEPPDQYTVE